MKKSPAFTELANLEIESKKLSQNTSSELIMNMKLLTDDPKTLELLDAVLAVHSAQRALEKLLK